MLLYKDKLDWLKKTETKSLYIFPKSSWSSVPYVSNIRLDLFRNEETLLVCAFQNMTL